MTNDLDVEDSSSLVSYSTSFVYHLTELIFSAPITIVTPACYCYAKHGSTKLFF